MNHRAPYLEVLRVFDLEDWIICVEHTSHYLDVTHLKILIILKTWHKVTYYSPYFIRIDYFCNIF